MREDHLLARAGAALSQVSHWVPGRPECAGRWNPGALRAPGAPPLRSPAPPPSAYAVANDPKDQQQPQNMPRQKRPFCALGHSKTSHRPAAPNRRYTGDRRSPKPFGRITQDTRVILASFGSDIRR